MGRVARAGAAVLVLLTVVVGAAVGAPPVAGAATTATAHGLGSARDLVVDPATGRVYVSGGDGVAVFAADGSLVTTIGGIPGAGPMALLGGSLWVAATGLPGMARVDLATSTVAQVVPVSGTFGDSIAVAAGAVFFVLVGTDDVVARLDVATGTITTFPSFGGVRVVSIPGATDRLAVHDRLTPTNVSIIGAAAPHAAITSVAAGGNANEIVVGPDGDTFWTVSAGGGLVQRRFSTGAQTDAVYPTDAHARHVAYGSARGGMLVSWSDASDQLFVSILGTTTGLSAIGTSAFVAGVGVATDGGAVFYADQTSLVRVTLGSSITSVTPTSTVAGVPATIVAKGVGLGGTTAATIGGLPATTSAVTPTQVSVAVPVALAAGTHPLVLTGPLGTATIPVTVVANTGASITGVVRIGGVAAPGVSVRVTGGGLTMPVELLTNNLGRYLASGLPLATGYRLTVSQPAGATSGHVVDGLSLVPNQVTTIDVALRSTTATPAFVTPTGLPGTGGLNAYEVEAGTGRVFLSRGSDVLVLGPDGAFAGRLIGLGPVRRIVSGNGVVFVSAATTTGDIRIHRIDPSSLQVTGSWLLDAPSNGEITLVGTRLFVLAGRLPSYESGAYDLRTFDPATGATTVVPAPRTYAGLQPVQRDANRLIGQNIAGTSVLDVSGPTAVATGQFFPPLVTFVVADGPTNRLWTSAGAELDLTTLQPTGRTFAATGVPRVAAGAGVILFGSTVFRLTDPARATHVLTPGQAWTLAPSGARAYGTIVLTNEFVAADLTPHVTLPAPGSVWASGSTVALTGFGLLPTSAVAIDGSGVPFTVVAHDRLDVAVGPLAPGPHHLTVTTPWGATAPLPFTVPAPPSGSVAGMVRSTAGPVAGAVVLISPAGVQSVAATAITGPDGTFTVASLPVGSYKVATLDPALVFGAPPAYVSAWYQDAGPGTTDFGAASSVVVVADTLTSLVPIVLGHTSPGSITGVVTDGTVPLANMAVIVSPAATPSVSATAVTGADGRFTVSGLAPGAYKVVTFDARAIFGLPVTYVGELYDDVPVSPTSFDESDVVVVDAGAATALVGIVLASA